MIKFLETPEETTTMNKDAAMSEEVKRNQCHSYVASIMTITFNMFLNKENIIGCYFSICAISFVAFVLYSKVVGECLCGCSKYINAYVVSHECNAFLVLCDVSYF